MTARVGEDAAYPPEPRQRALYAAFDRFPSSKGAAVHIRHMAGTLFERYGGGLLCALGGPGLPRYQHEAGIEVVRLGEAVPNLLDRAASFSDLVAAQVWRHRADLRICHVRDPWGALPVVAPPARRYKVLYEVNGLPSVELPEAWPVAPATVAKLRRLEERALAAADAVVVPSRVLAGLLADRGVATDRLHVIPNGADVVATPPPRPAGAPARYLIYVGALQRWQGVDTLLRAFARLADLDVRLVVCASVAERRARALRRLAGRLGLDDRVLWRFELPHDEVAGWLAGAEASVAPLADCARNAEQGCCPLKVLESMAAGTPVVASDLPAVRELLTDGEHGTLVPADRPAALARALRVLLDHPETARDLGLAARRHVEASLTWAHATAALRALYARLDPVQPGSLDSARVLA